MPPDGVTIPVVVVNVHPAKTMTSNDNELMIVVVVVMMRRCCLLTLIVVALRIGRWCGGVVGGGGGVKGLLQCVREGSFAHQLFLCCRRCLPLYNCLLLRQLVKSKNKRSQLLLVVVVVGLARSY